MTELSEAYDKLANVTGQLGRERSRADRLQADYDLLRDDYDALLQSNRDLQRRVEQLREQLRGEDDRPRLRLED